MAGYSGYSMSNNAVYAYSNGEKPLSKWTKAAFIEAVEGELEDEELKIVLPFVKKMTAKQIKTEYLEYAGWHHTSKFYNKTEFWTVDFEKLKDDSGVEKTNCPKKLIVYNLTWRDLIYSSTGKHFWVEKMIKKAYAYGSDVAGFSFYDEKNKAMGFLVNPSLVKYEKMEVAE